MGSTENENVFTDDFQETNSPITAPDFEDIPTTGEREIAGATAEEKPFKWFAVQIVAKAKTKAGLKKILKDTDPKKYPTIIRGDEKKPEWKTTHQMIF